MEFDGTLDSLPAELIERVGDYLEDDARALGRLSTASKHYEGSLVRPMARARSTWRERKLRESQKRFRKAFGASKSLLKLATWEDDPVGSTADLLRDSWRTPQLAGFVTPENPEEILRILNMKAPEKCSLIYPPVNADGYVERPIEEGTSLRRVLQDAAASGSWRFSRIYCDAST